MDDKTYISRFRYVPPDEQGVTTSGCRNTTIYRRSSDYPDAPTVFTTESGAIGMESHGRIAIKTIEAWIAMAWGDISQ